MTHDHAVIGVSIADHITDVARSDITVTPHRTGQCIQQIRRGLVLTYILENDVFICTGLLTLESELSTLNLRAKIDDHLTGDDEIIRAWIQYEAVDLPIVHRNIGCLLEAVLYALYRLILKPGLQIRPAREYHVEVRAVLVRGDAIQKLTLTCLLTDDTYRHDELGPRHLLHHDLLRTCVLTVRRLQCMDRVNQLLVGSLSIICHI